LVVVKLGEICIFHCLHHTIGVKGGLGHSRTEWPEAAPQLGPRPHLPTTVLLLFGAKEATTVGLESGNIEHPKFSTHDPKIALQPKIDSFLFHFLVWGNLCHSIVVP